MRCTLALAAVTTTIAMAVCAEAGESPRLIAIEYSARVPGDITLRVSAPVRATALAIAATDFLPDRIAIDLFNTKLAEKPPSPPSTNPPILRVRVAQRDPDTVRVVVDLEHTTRFRLHTVGDRVQLTLGTATVPVASTPAQTDAEKPMPASQPAAAPTPQAALPPAVPATSPQKTARPAAPPDRRPASTQRSASDWIRLRRTARSQPKLIYDLGQFQTADSP